MSKARADAGDDLPIFQGLPSDHEIKGSVDTLVNRIENFPIRAIAIEKGQAFQNLYEERQGLYSRYADVAIDCEDWLRDELPDAILNAINAQSSTRLFPVKTFDIK